MLATDEHFVLTAWNPGAERMFGWTAAEAVGRRVDELIPTSYSDEELAAEMSHLVQTGQWRDLAAFYGKAGDAVIADALTVALHSEQGETTGYLCILRDSTELSKTTARLETAARQQAVLAELSVRALGSGQLQTLLDNVVMVVADVLGVALTWVGGVEPDGGGLGWRAAFGWPAGDVARAPAVSADSGSFVGYTLTVDKPVVSEDLNADERFGLPPMFAARAPVSGVAVVIPGADRPFGVLAVAAQELRQFDGEEVNFVQAVANMIGVAVERARADARLDAAREAERRRIARELHDDGLRELTDAIAIVAMARTSPAQRDEASWAALSMALQSIGQQLRGAIYDLRLGTDEDRAFVDLMEDLVAVQAQLAGGRPIELRGEEKLPSGGGWDAAARRSCGSFEKRSSTPAAIHRPR